MKIHRIPLIPRGDGRKWRLAITYLSSALFFCLYAPLIGRKKYDVVFVFRHVASNGGVACDYREVAVQSPDRHVDPRLVAGECLGDRRITNKTILGLDSIFSPLHLPKMRQYFDFVARVRGEHPGK